jgi:hypothetical protein
MFSLNDLISMGFSAENILDGIDVIMSEDEVAQYSYLFLKDNDCVMPKDLEEYYKTHCE